MRLIEKLGVVEIWHDPVVDEYYVYGVTRSGDPRICPSIGMAREVAASVSVKRDSQPRDYAASSIIRRPR